MKSRLAVFLLLLSALAAHAADALPDPQQEARAIALGNELRCVVCQAESINDSQAEMSRDMRHLIRDKIRSGQSDRQIIDFLRSRYGDFILLNPPVQANTYLLWLTPLFILSAAGLGLGFFLRANRGVVKERQQADNHLK